MGSDNKKRLAIPNMPQYGFKKTPEVLVEDNAGRLAGDYNRGYSFSDPSDLYAQRGYIIEFEYFHADEAVKFVDFKAFITDFTDNYASNWNSEEVYGRADPIYTFQNTTRTINLSWDVPSSGIDEAAHNLAKASKMMRFLYPSYTQDGNASTLTKPPLLRMRFVNLIKKDDTTGLLGKVNGFTFAPDLEVGWWDGHNKNSKKNPLYPKLLRFSCEFSVIHEHHLGWHDCTGLWEVVCGKSGAQNFDPQKAAWPYIPVGESANGYLSVPNPVDINGSDEVVADGVGTESATQAEAEKIDRSSTSAQGVTKSEQENARKVKESQQGSQPLARPAMPPEEQEAEDQSTLGGS